jgi:hypothetical protein
MIGARSTAAGTPLRAGDLVYRVIEVDLPPNIPGRHTWEVASVVIERASSKQIKLSAHFTGLANKVFDPDAFGRVFFETPLQAIQYFLSSKRLEIESLDRRRKEVERATAWAEIETGKYP